MDPVIIVALISSVLGPCAVAWLQRRDLNHRVGTPNGQGNMVEMAERLLAGQSTQDERLGRIEGCVTRLDTRVSRLEGDRAA